MKIEIRPLNPDTEFVRFTEIRHNAYHMPFDGTAVNTHLFNAHETRCLFVDGQMQATGRLFPFAQSLHGRLLPMGGIASIAVPMEERGNGHIRRLLTHLFAEMRDRGMALTTLYTDTHALYRRFGFEVVAEVRNVQVPTQELVFDQEALRVAGRITRATEADVPVIKSLYERYLKQYNGLIVRDDFHWQHRRFSAPLVNGSFSRQVFLWHDAGGEAQGYMMWEPIEDGQLVIREWVALHAAAEVGLLDFIRRDNLLREVVWTAESLDHPLTTLLQKPALGSRIEPGFMARIVDVMQAWQTVSQEAVDGQIVLEVRDDRCDWNQGRFQVTVERGHASVSRTTEEPHACADIRTWTQLFYGAVNVGQAMHLGTLHVQDAGALPFLKRLWATDFRPRMIDRF